MSSYLHPSQLICGLWFISTDGVRQVCSYSVLAPLFTEGHFSHLQGKSTNFNPIGSPIFSIIIYLVCICILNMDAFGQMGEVWWQFIPCTDVFLRLITLSHRNNHHHAHYFDGKNFLDPKIRLSAIYFSFEGRGSEQNWMLWSQITVHSVSRVATHFFTHLSVPIYLFGTFPIIKGLYNGQKGSVWTCQKSEAEQT